MKGKKVAVIGLGKSGLSTVNFLLKNNIVPDVFDTRNSPKCADQLSSEVKLITGELDGNVLSSYDVLVVGPGLALSLPALSFAAKNGTEIIGDIELFARYVNKPIIGITGSNGKSTVTTLAHLIMNESGFKCAVGGNIGIPALDIIEDDVDVYVLELSSFELETTKSLKLKSATILNLSEDHLDRYQSSMKLYLEAKQRIFKNAENIIINRDDNATIPPSNEYVASFGEDEQNYGRIEKDGKKYLACNGEAIIAVDDVLIKGKHNEMNALAAIALTDYANATRTAQVKVLSSFSGLAHRCQLVKEINGVRYYNDSKATNVGSTLAAVAGLKESVKGKLILLAGGLGKGQNFAPIQAMLGKEVDLMLCFGKDGPMLADLGKEAELVEDMKAAILKAHSFAKDGDVVLLAPACASLDQFASFEQRGDVFAEIVRGL